MNNVQWKRLKVGQRHAKILVRLIAPDKAKRTLVGTRVRSIGATEWSTRLSKPG